MIFLLVSNVWCLILFQMSALEGLLRQPNWRNLEEAGRLITVGGNGAGSLKRKSKKIKFSAFEFPLSCNRTVSISLYQSKGKELSVFIFTRYLVIFANQIFPKCVYEGKNEKLLKRKGSDATSFRKNPKIFRGNI